MAAATDQQVQQYVDTRIRPFCEAIRDLEVNADGITSSIGDIYDALVNNPTWKDTRTDAPPHLMSPDDVLAVNTVVNSFLTYQKAEGQWPIIIKSCVKPPGA